MALVEAHTWTFQFAHKPLCGRFPGTYFVWVHFVLPELRGHVAALASCSSPPFWVVP